MKCFFYFRNKSRSRRHQRSAPELKGELESDFSGCSRTAASSCSLTSTRSVPELYEEKAHNLRVFSFAEMREATHDFNRLLKIGQGGFGSVFKGSIKPIDGKGDPLVVAIKQLSKDGLQGHKQWLAEVQFLGIVEHPNLVQLVGYCAVDGTRGIQRLLIYEYVTNRSLEDHLFNKALPTLAWKTRLQIVLGAAQGLAYRIWWGGFHIHPLENLRYSERRSFGPLHIAISLMVWERGFHTFLRNVSFPFPIEVGSHRCYLKG